MLFCNTAEFDLILGLILIVLYGLYSLRNNMIWLADLHVFCQLWPLLVVISYLVDGCDIFQGDSVLDNIATLSTSTLTMDMLLALFTVVIIAKFRSSFESMLLLLLAFIGQLGLLHSCDLVSFYISLELQNFAFLVLCGLQPDSNRSSNSNKGRSLNSTSMSSSKDGCPSVRSGLFSVEAALKFALLSAFSSGFLLYWFSTLYFNTGTTTLFFKSASLDYSNNIESYQILLALLFKLGVAPLHLWVVDIYGSVKRSLIMYISTAPKLSLYGFWISSWHSSWTSYSIALFALFSLVIGTMGAYGQPALRNLFAYSTINELGLLLSALETAGFTSLIQHLFIYMVTQVLLWDLADKRLFSIVAVSLAGMPPLLGFFGKAWIIAHVASTNLVLLLLVALLTTGIGLVYYIRVIRLFWQKPSGFSINNLVSGLTSSYRTVGISSYSTYTTLDYVHNYKLKSSMLLTAALVIFLVFGPIFFIKPFVL